MSYTAGVIGAAVILGVVTLLWCCAVVARRADDIVAGMYQRERDHYHGRET